MYKYHVNSNFDGGSIVVRDLTDISKLRFSVRNDTNSHFAQWFYFQLSGIQDENVTCILEDLDKTAYPQGWYDYDVCASYDNQEWFRVPTTYQNHQLTWSLVAERNTIYFAYFEPYSYARHLQLIGNVSRHANVAHEILGQTSHGRNLDLLKIGNPDAPLKIWLIARQHPGETMAEWFMEGVLYRLVDGGDAISRSLLQQCVFYVIPNMNPDGGYLGNLRTNAEGSNLNREWLNPSLEKSPEVYLTRAKMLSVGVNLFLDIHGDESLPYVFTASCSDNPSYSPLQEQLTDQFQQLFSLINPDYQTEYGYGEGHFSDETPTLACNWVGNQFACLALTLEMPFKDNANLPERRVGWNGTRSAHLGASILNVIHALLAKLAP